MTDVLQTAEDIITIEKEMKRSYLEYSMSVIIGRALPDVRDGLKPVHRRVLFGMYDLNNYYNRPYKKSARVVGDVMGKYHPHGDSAIYDTLVRMAQDFSLRYPIVDGQGNFGSIDGDSPAAMRYTEVRMTRLGQAFLSDIDKETVDFLPNYDGTIEEPVILPTTVPNLLVNGSSGIAVGMATNIPPHNLSEVCNGIIKIIEEPDVSINDLIKVIPGPDFPTAAFIMGRSGISEAYKTGRGIIRLRARAFIETSGQNQNKERIVISEIPYQVTKAKLLEKFAELVNEKKIEGISDIRDESDKDGIRVVLDLKKDAIPLVVLNRLYKYTQLETSFGIIFLAIVDGEPKILNLKEMLLHFIDHRRNIITRRTKFELRKAEERAHILEGLKRALDHLDAIISLIRSSLDPQKAKTSLKEQFEFSEMQAQAILEMRLQRLTGLEREKIVAEFEELLKNIERFKAILSSPSLILQLIKEEMEELKAGYGDERRTEILEKPEEIEAVDLIANEEMVVTISHRGYIKRNPMTLYRAQKRGGKGLTGVKTVEDDFVEMLFIASSHDYLLFFTNIGRVYWKKVHEVPEGSRLARGKAIINLLNLQPNEKVATILSVKDFQSGRYIVMATRCGIIKKTEFSAFSNPRNTGIIALTIRDEDELIGVCVTDGAKDILMATKNGKSIRFSETDLRSMGRGASGIIGIRFDGEDSLVSMESIENGATLLTVTEKGYGKRTITEEYRAQGRGGKGILTIKTSERNGSVVKALQVMDNDQVMLITSDGKIIRIKVEDISVIGRNTQGVRLINLFSQEKVVAVAKVIEE